MNNFSGREPPNKPTSLILTSTLLTISPRYMPEIVFSNIYSQGLMLSASISLSNSVKGRQLVNAPHSILSTIIPDLAICSDSLGIASMRST
nr:hypothetical protein Iba_chr15eCG2240 [Ipomoea batatas]